jgi:pimeloyl-ACP methyl ester carboxylesterase
MGSIDSSEACAHSTAASNPRSCQTVFLLHGIACNSWHTAWMAAKLRRLGYKVQNRGYNSLFRSLSDLGEQLSLQLEAESRLEGIDRIHIVAHSMGTIVTRAALARKKTDKLDRVVLLAPPNRGSPVARRFAPFTGWLFKPVPELSDDPASYVNSLPKDVGTSYGVITSKIDWIVPHQSTYLGSESDRAKVGGIHSMMVFRKETVELVDQFLQTGKFQSQ